MPDVPDNMLLPSQNQFRVMCKMYPNKEISFSDQKIFTQERWFRAEMRKLVNWGRVEMLNGIHLDARRHSEKYRLTFNGGIIVEFLQKYHERNVNAQN